MSPDDRRWLWLVYGTVFVPLVGQPLVVLASSVLYYRWRRAWPEAAVRLNVHAWIPAWARRRDIRSNHPTS